MSESKGGAPLIQAYEKITAVLHIAPLDHDPALSWKAKGLLAYMLTRPPVWTLRVSDLINRSKDGRDGVQAGVRELRDAGYIYLERLSPGEGGGSRYHVCPFRRTPEEWAEHLANPPTTGKAGSPPRTGFPGAGKPGSLEVSQRELINDPPVGPPSRASKTTKKGAHECPEDFTPTAAHRALHASLGLPREIEWYRDEFVDWFRDKGTRRKRWGGSFSRWLRRSAVDLEEKRKAEEAKAPSGEGDTFWGAGASDPQSW